MTDTNTKTSTAEQPRPRHLGWIGWNLKFREGPANHLYDEWDPAALAEAIADIVPREVLVEALQRLLGQDRRELDPKWTRKVRAASQPTREAVEEAILAAFIDVDGSTVLNGKKLDDHTLASPARGKS
jgi:hypothetical protein